MSNIEARVGHENYPLNDLAQSRLDVLRQPGVVQDFITQLLGQKNEKPHLVGRPSATTMAIVEALTSAEVRVCIQRVAKCVLERGIENIRNSAQDVAQECSDILDAPDTPQ